MIDACAVEVTSCELLAICYLLSAVTNNKTHAREEGEGKREKVNEREGKEKGEGKGKGIMGNRQTVFAARLMTSSSVALSLDNSGVCRVY